MIIHRIFVVFWLFMLFLPYFLPYTATMIDPMSEGFRSPLEAWQTGHWLGTDRIGRDILAGIAEGSHIALLIGVGASILLTFLGIFIGTLSVYSRAVLRFMDIFQAIPTLLLLFGLLASVEQKSTLTLCLLLGSISWLSTARLVRAEIWRVRSMDYVLSAKALGYPPRMIFFRHILPHIFAPIRANFALSVANMIAAEAGLSFLGLGLPPDIVTWGGLLQLCWYDAAPWWVAFLLVSVITLATFSFARVKCE